MASETRGPLARHFAKVVEMAPAERAAFLDRCAREDPELERELRGLLAADRHASDFLLPRAAGSDSPDTIGPYRVVRKLGQGGMGEVFLALRDDDRFHRLVAVKIVRDSDPDAFRRFSNERRILASLEHPNIARLYDAGTLERGVPYFVLEHVSGVPIDEHCASLPIRRRIELFLAVCTAVSFAHRNLVIHRDLKPSNILVTTSGDVKLLDFGVARLVNPDQVPPSVEATAGWNRFLTPEYASPEQLRGKPLTTATDIYSLGVVLYRLLTGQVPHRAHGRSAAELEHAVCHEEPVAPSRATALPLTGARNASDLPRDLDLIAQTALHKEPGERYDSVDRLAEDLERFLDDRPIAARPPSPLYRASRLVRRHRWAAGFATLMALTILGALIGLSLLSRSLSAERDVAQVERDKARRVADALAEVFSAASPNRNRGEPISAQSLLDLGRRQVLDRLSGEPLARAELARVIGNAYREHDLVEESQALLTLAHDERRSFAGARHPDTIQSSDDLGLLALHRGDYAQAETLFRSGLEARRAAGAGELEVATSLHHLGTALLEQGRPRQAKRLYRRSLALRSAHLTPGAAELSDSLQALASVLFDEGEYLEAEPVARSALASARAARGEQSLEAAAASTTLGLTLAELEETEEAERHLSRALEIHRDLLGEEHRLILQDLNNLASLMGLIGDPEAALAYYLQALPLGRKVLGPRHQKLPYLLLGAGGAHTSLGAPRTGEPFLREALDIRREALPANHWLIHWSEAILGRNLHLQGRLSEARPLIEAGIRGLVETRPEGDRLIDTARGYLAQLELDPASANAG